MRAIGGCVAATVAAMAISGAGSAQAAVGCNVGDNKANNNGDWGIIATELIVDLGGNTASGNFQAAQCSGVSCN